jgi:DnaK suppressor protein
MILDEQQIQEMLSSEYMNDDQVKFFKNLLLSKKDVLSARILEREQSLTVSEKVADAADAGTIEEDRNLTMELLQRERAEIKAVGQALVRIDEDCYGWCDQTGEPIGIRRLLSNPTAALCYDAQTRLEQVGRHLRPVAA